MIKGMKCIGLYRYRKKITAPDTTDITAVGPKVKRGQLLELTHLSVLDYTTGNKQLAVGYRDANEVNHFVRTEKASAKRECHMTGRLFLIENDEPIGFVDSPTANNVIYFTAHGLIYEYPS